jgi:poly-gamma-glutamate synthesis protein (capsule biosynthesis protein)
MSSVTDSKLHRVALPPNARAFVKFEGEFAATVERLTREALEAGRWDTPEDHELDISNPMTWAYWLQKSSTPIVRGRPGCGVEERMEPFRRTHFELLPPGFQLESEVKMSVAGDLMCFKGLDGAKDRLYEDVADLLFGADIAFANLESTLTQNAIGAIVVQADDTPKINLTPAQYDALVSHRGRYFDVLQLANNHILDCGEEGVRTTLSYLKRDGIEQVGVNETAADAAQPRITELKGLRIGWVVHTFSVNFKPFPEDKPWIVNMTPFHLVKEPDLSNIESQIRACRNAGCDLVFVALHWGLEFELYPHPQQFEWAHRFAEAGADIVIGHHPHVPQPVEIYRPQSDPSRAVPILYSIGNLTSVVSHPASVLCLVARLRLATGRVGAKRRTVIAGMELTPVALVSEGTGEAAVVKLVPAARLLQQRHDADMNAYVDEIASYADIVVGTGWRDAANVSQ